MKEQTRKDAEALVRSIDDVNRSGELQTTLKKVKFREIDIPHKALGTRH